MTLRNQHGEAPLVAVSTAYRPQIIEGGYRRNPHRRPLRAGWPWASDRWRIWMVDDGILSWQHGSQRHECPAGTWVVHQPDRITSHVDASPGSRWAQLRFRLCPSDPAGDPLAESAWGVQMPALLPAAVNQAFRPAMHDILAWWWRDPWHLVRAEARLASLLVDIAARFHPSTSTTDTAPANGTAKSTATATTTADANPFAPADRLWRTRPLASVDDLASACGMAPRTFRRRFQAARGRSPSVYARTVMASQACDLLRERPTWSIEQIARHIGYAHASTFVRAFTAELGQPPARWRQQRRQT